MRQIIIFLTTYGSANWKPGSVGCRVLRIQEAAKHEWKKVKTLALLIVTTGCMRLSGPELFFKSLPHRVVGPGGEVNIRKDFTWNVPEPELTLFINSLSDIQAYTIGNDMSSRSIEGENPLYLPQAKVYEKSASIGPCLYILPEPIPHDTKISLVISRDGKTMYEDSTPISRMKRTLPELAEYLYQEMDFPAGAFLMTGTCLVPPNDFTLQKGDLIEICIDEIGTLINTVGLKEG